MEVISSEEYLLKQVEPYCLGLYSSYTISNCVTLGKLINLSRPQFLLL